MFISTFGWKLTYTYLLYKRILVPIFNTMGKQNSLRRILQWETAQDDQLDNLNFKSYSVLHTLQAKI